MKTPALLCAAAFALAGVSSITQAAWPDKPITIIVPAAPGGTADISTRLLSDKLAAVLGTTVVVENKAGAAGIIGSQALIRSAPDGYTIDMGNIGPNAINYSLYKKLPYKPEDFSAITLVISVPNILVVNSKSPYNTVKELVDDMKKNPTGNFSFGSSGAGQSPHLSGEMFLQRSGLQAAHIPYKGAGPAVSALLGNQFTFMIDNLPSSMPYIKSGQVRPIGVSTLKRSPLLSELPAIAETYPGFEVNSWYGMMAPAKTPANIVNLLQKEVAKILQMPEIIQTLQAAGLSVEGTTPEQYAEQIKRDLSRWQTAVAKAGIQKQ